MVPKSDSEQLPKRTNLLGGQNWQEHGLRVTPDMDWRTLAPFCTKDKLQESVHRRLMGNIATSNTLLKLQLFFDGSATHHKMHNTSQRQTMLNKRAYTKRLFGVLVENLCRSLAPQHCFVWYARGGAPLLVWIVEENASKVHGKWWCSWRLSVCFLLCVRKH